MLHSPSGYWQTKVLRREDPYLKVGEVNDRAHKDASEYVWALKGIYISKHLQNISKALENIKKWCKEIPA